MVTPYPPVRDGIGAYAAQQVAQLLEKGEDVEVLSPTPSAAHHHLDFTSWRGSFALAKRVRGYDRVIVQFHPDVLYPYPASRRLRLMITVGLVLAFRLAPNLEITVHEFDTRSGKGLGLLPFFTRMLWRSADRIVVHTASERDDLCAAFGVAKERVEIEDHGRYFVARTELDREQAREHLGVLTDGHLFLAIGFIQSHKGFDRAIDAFRGLDAVGAQLYVVGSVRTGEAGAVAYAESLHESAERTPGVVVREEYVSDEEFDVWIRAADTVVLPYRYIWSSGVLERCELLGRPAIAARVGGLDQQAHEGVELFDTDDQLRAAMVRRAGADGKVAPAIVGPFPDPSRRADGSIDRDALQALVRERAGHTGTRIAHHRPWATGSGSSAARPRPLAVRRLGLYAGATPTSARPGVSMVKRVIQRLTAWQVDPLAHQLNSLHTAVRTDLDALRQTTRTDAAGTAAEEGTR